MGHCHFQGVITPIGSAKTGVKKWSTGQGVFLPLVKGSMIIFATYCYRIVVTQILVPLNCQEPLWSVVKQQNDCQIFICSCAYGSAHLLSFHCAILPHTVIVSNYNLGGGTRISGPKINTAGAPEEREARRQREREGQQDRETRLQQEKEKEHQQELLSTHYSYHWIIHTIAYVLNTCMYYVLSNLNSSTSPNTACMPT